MWIKFEPLERGKGFEFVEETVGGSVPKNVAAEVIAKVRKRKQAANA